MSQAGKETLVKSVLQAIPTYMMGVCKLPCSVCDDLTQLVRNFWWGSKQGQRKTHWLAWDKIIEPKGKGGLGFRDFRLFNQALLAREAWHLLTNPVSLCSQVLKAKYYPNGSLEDTIFAGNASPTWHAIQHGLELLKKGSSGEWGMANTSAYGGTLGYRVQHRTDRSHQGAHASLGGCLNSWT